MHKGNKISREQMLEALGKNAPTKPPITEEKQQWTNSV